MARLLDPVLTEGGDEDTLVAMKIADKRLILATQSENGVSRDHAFQI
jgi:hypothetical protein